MGLRRIHSIAYANGELALNGSSPCERMTDLHEMFTISFLCADNPHSGSIQVDVLFLPYPLIFSSMSTNPAPFSILWSPQSIFFRLGTHSSQHSPTIPPNELHTSSLL